MEPTDLRQIAAWCGGRLIQGRPSDLLSQVSVDTRGLSGGELFVALKGADRDGHAFLEDAARAGAAALLVSVLNQATEAYAGAIIHVRDTLVALQELALRYRRSRPGLFVAGITGSNGKTSTKDFLAAALSRREEVSATAGNFNNHIGLPLSVLMAEARHSAAVWEMGMNHPGEIEVLAEIAGPDAAVITGIGTAHIEHLKTREAIAEEKGMLAEAVGEDGFVILPAGDPFTPSLAARCRARVITAGLGAGEVRATGARPSAAGGVAFLLEARGRKAEVELAVPGEHMAVNAVLAAAAALERGMDLEEIAAGLGAARLGQGRLQRRRAGGIDFLDDSYNANPDSMRAAFRALEALAAGGRRVAVLGRMAELGESEESEHRALGAALAESGIDVLVAVGETGAWIAGGAGGAVGTTRLAATPEEAAGLLRELVLPGDLVLVKGSRSARMERVIEACRSEEDNA